MVLTDYINDYLIDIIIVLVIILNILIGRKRGFAAVLLSLSLSVAGIIIARNFSVPLAQSVFDDIIRPKLINSVSEIVKEKLSSGADAITSALPSYLVTLTDGAGISVSDSIRGMISSADVSAISEKITNSVETALFPLICRLAFVFLFFIWRVISIVISAVISSAVKLPVIKSFDKTLGGTFGALKGIIITVILCLILIVCKNAFAGQEISEIINSSIIVNGFEEIFNTFLN